MGREAFGARRFIGYTVFFALGLTALVSSELWHRHARAVRLVATCLIASNVLFLAQYQVAMRSGGDIVEYPVTAAQVLLERLRRRGAFSVAWHETKRLSGASSGPEPTGPAGAGGRADRPRLGSSRLPKTSRFEAAVPVPMSTRPERVPSR